MTNQPLSNNIIKTTMNRLKTQTLSASRGRTRAVGTLALMLLAGGQPAQALNYYWDTTSPIETAGFGTAGGTWGTDALWSDSNAGTATWGRSIFR